MMKKLLWAGLMMSAAAPALAQGGPPASPFAPLADKPTCTRDELKAATAAYVQAQKSGSLAGLPLDAKAHFLENMSTVEKDKGLWNTALPIAHDMSFHDDLRCKTFTELIVTEAAIPMSSAPGST